MEFQSPGALLVHIGSITIRWYGVMVALGFLAATLIAAHWGPKEGITRENCINGALIGFVGGVLGGRLYFVACKWPQFAAEPWRILATWEGGMSIHGGIIGGFAAGLAYCYFAGMPVLRCMDIGGCATVLAQAIGRWGNFFNSEAFGKPVGNDFFLKLFIPMDCRPEGYVQYDFFHPTFLYESVVNFAIFCLLFFYLLNKLKNYPGVCFFVYLAIYSVARLAIEPLRLDSIMASNNVPIPVIASAAELVASIVIIIGLVFYHNNRMKKARQAGALESAPTPSPEGVENGHDSGGNKQENNHQNHALESNK